MRSKTRLLFAIPFVVLPVVVVVLLSSCSRGGSSPSETVRAPRQAVSGAPCDAGSCVPLDEFDISLASQSDAGWLTFSRPPGDAGCEAMADALQDAVNTIARNTLASKAPDAAVAPTVLYLPHDTYDICKTIWVQGALGGAIIGDDPSNTIINWTGSVDGSAMFLFLDSQSTKLARLTLNGGLTNAPESDGGGTPSLTGVMVMDAPYGDADGGSPNLAPPYLQRDGGPAGKFPVYFLEFDDDVFENLSFGITATSGGLPGVNENDEPSDGGDPFSEVTSYHFNPSFYTSGSNVGNSDVRRCSFENILVQGIALSGQNTIDWLIEDNAFINCHRGVTLTTSANADLVNNLFFNDNGDDSLNVYSNSDSFSVYRGNVSVGANMFYYCLNREAADMSGNYILLNTNGSDAGTGNQHCYGVLSGGQLTFLDNYISGPSNSDPCSQEHHTACVGSNGFHYGALAIQGRIAHGHNAYSGTAAGFVQTLYQNSGWNRLEACVGGDGGCDNSNQSADTFGVVDAGDVPTAAQNAYVGWGSPALGADAGTVMRPTIAPAVTRTVVLAPSACLTNSPSNGCASAIASLLPGDGGGGSYLLYFPRHVYYIDNQIEIPANLDVVVAGDGVTTELDWVGTALDAYVFHANAPSKAMFRDFEIACALDSSSRPGGILVDSHDDSNDLVYADVLGGSGMKSALQIAGLDNVLVRAEQAGGNPVERGVEVIGGGAGAQDGGSSNTQGLLAVASGWATYSDFASVRNWGKVVVIGSDSESTQGMSLNQSGYLTMDTGRFISTPEPDPRDYGVGQPNVVVASTFRGNVTFMNMGTMSGVYSTGAHQARVLALGNAYFPISQFGQTLDGPPIPACTTTYTVDGQGCVNPPLADGSLVLQSSAGMTQMGVENVGECLHSGRIQDEPYSDVSNGSEAKGAFLETMLTDTRWAPNAAPICSSTCGPTRVRIHNVTMLGSNQTLNTTPPSSLMRAGLRVQRSN